MTEVIRGYTCPINEFGTEQNGYYHWLKPDAITFADNVRALVDHDDDRQLAATTDDSLIINTTDAGVDFWLKVPSTVLGRKMLFEARKGRMQCSVGYKIVQHSWTVVNHRILQVLHEIRVEEITLTQNPAFPQTWAREATPDDLAECRQLFADPPEREYREPRSRYRDTVGHGRLVLC